MTGITKVSELPTAGALTGAELLLGVQDGESVKIEGQALATIPALVAAVSDSESHAAAAEAARDAAQLSAGVYASTTAGLAATTNGHYFSVPSADNSESLILYQNSAGVAVEVKRYPSTAAVSAIGASIKSTTPEGKLLSVTDQDGYEQATIYADGSIRTVAMNLQASTYAFRVIDQEGWVAFDAEKPPSPSVGESPAFGKKFLLFGDSITQTGDPDNGNFGTSYRANWPLYAQPLLQMASLHNYARSGAAFREYGQLDWQKISKQVNTAIANGEAPDIVGVSCGTNDGTTSLGDYATAMSKTTLASLDMTKTIEAMRWAFWTIRLSFPAAFCFAVLPLQRADVETTDRQPLLDAITQMAKRYGFLVIDAHSESGIVKDFEVWQALGRDLYDGLHPGATGQVKMANLIVSKIKAAINY